MKLLENRGVGGLKLLTYIVKWLKYGVVNLRKLVNHLWSYLMGYTGLLWFVISLFEPSKVQSSLYFIIALLCLVTHRQEHSVHKSEVTTIVTIEEEK